MTNNVQSEWTHQLGNGDPFIHRLYPCCIQMNEKLQRHHCTLRTALVSKLGRILIRISSSSDCRVRRSVCTFGQVAESLLFAHLTFSLAMIRLTYQIRSESDPPKILRDYQQNRNLISLVLAQVVLSPDWLWQMPSNFKNAQRQHSPSFKLNWIK